MNRILPNSYSMKNKILYQILFFLFAPFGFMLGQTPTNITSDPHWKQIFLDDFSTETVINTNIWQVGNNFDHYNSNVVQLANNVFIDAGHLVLRLTNAQFGG